MSADSIETLQTRIAYQDDAIDTLSHQVYTQSREIEHLKQRCREIEKRLQTMLEAGGTTPTVDETPPHY